MGKVHTLCPSLAFPYVVAVADEEYSKVPCDPSLQREVRNTTFDRLDGEKGRSYVFEFCPTSGGKVFSYCQASVLTADRSNRRRRNARDLGSKLLTPVLR